MRLTKNPQSRKHFKSALRPTANGHCGRKIVLKRSKREKRESSQPVPLRTKDHELRIHSFQKTPQF